MMCRSVRHTPAPPIFTITSSGPVIFGSGTSSMTGVSWNLWIRTAFTCSSRSRNRLRGVLGRPAVRVADPEHARADGRVGVDAGPRDAGLAEVDRHRCLVDPCPGLRIDEQRGVVARGQAEFGAA